MEKLIYELKPFAFFFFSLYAIHSVHAYRPLMLSSGFLLIMVATLIMTMRFRYRSQKLHSRRK
jgi:hypothetical protein